MAGDLAMSHLQVQLNDYVAMRRATGFKFVQAARLLSNFVDHLERHGSDVVTSTAAISWASAARGHPNWWARRLSLVGGLARYLRDREPGHEVPPPGLFPTRPSRATPYLYTDEDIGRLMEAARSPRTSIGPAMFRITSARTDLEIREVPSILPVPSEGNSVARPGCTLRKGSLPERKPKQHRHAGGSPGTSCPEPDYLAMSREWAAKNGHPNELTAEQIAACVTILRPSLLAMAQERMAARRKRGKAA